MPIACCIPKATNTHSEYVLVVALPLLVLFTFVTVKIKLKNRLILRQPILSRFSSWHNDIAAMCSNVDKHVFIPVEQHCYDEELQM